MKALFLVAALMGTQAFGSHFIECELEAKVVGVESIARLNGVAIFSRRANNDHEQNLQLEVTKVISVGGRDRGCLPVGTKQTLSVSKSEIGTYKKDDVLKLSYRNIGDAMASRVSWDVRK